MDGQTQTTNVSDATVTSPVTQATSNDTLKGILIWFLPIIGGLIYMNDADNFVKSNARQSIAYGLLLLVISIVASITFILACVPVLIWVVVGIMMVMKFSNKQSVAMPVVDDVVKMLWK